MKTPSSVDFVYKSLTRCTLVQKRSAYQTSYESLYQIHNEMKNCCRCNVKLEPYTEVVCPDMPRILTISTKQFSEKFELFPSPESQLNRLYT